MKRAFTLIEILISIFVLSLAFIGLAATFAATTRQIKQNAEEIEARTLRRSAEAYYPFLHRERDFQLGWNIEYVDNLSNQYKILYLTYKTNYLPTTIIVATFKGEKSVYVTNKDNYSPVNNDILVSWYGFKHIVKDDTYIMQNAELQEDFVVMPFEKMSVLDVHRKDSYENMETK